MRGAAVLMLAVVLGCHSERPATPEAPAPPVAETRSELISAGDASTARAYAIECEHPAYRFGDGLYEALAACNRESERVCTDGYLTHKEQVWAGGLTGCFAGPSVVTRTILCRCPPNAIACSETPPPPPVIIPAKPGRPLMTWDLWGKKWAKGWCYGTWWQDDRGYGSIVCAETETECNEKLLADRKKQYVASDCVELKRTPTESN